MLNFGTISSGLGGDLRPTTGALNRSAITLLVIIGLLA